MTLESRLRQSVSQSVSETDSPCGLGRRTEESECRGFLSFAINVVDGGGREGGTRERASEHIDDDAANVKIVSNLIPLGAARRFRTRLSTASHKNQDRLTVGEGRKGEETVIWGSTSCPLDCGKNSSSTQINLISPDAAVKS